MTSPPRTQSRVYALTWQILPVALLAALAAGCAAAAASSPRPPSDRQLAGLMEAVRWPHPADAAVMSLASLLVATRQDETGYRYFGERAAAAPDRPLFLALQGMFQARMAGQVFLLRRVAWVEEAAARLDQAVSRDGGLSRVVRGLTLARLPARFRRADDAAADLRWALEAPGSPLLSGAAPANIAAGLRRAAWQALAYAHATAGRAEASREALRRSGVAGLGEEAAPLAIPYSLSARDGFRFGPPGILSDGDVHVVTGYDFADIAFVVTSAGVVAIDAGTTPESAGAALAAFRRQVSAAPIRAVLVTHAHWDHVGGLAAIAGPGTEVVASERYAEEVARERQIGAGPRWFFGERFRVDQALGFTPTRTVSGRTTLRYGNTEFELIPVRGGETDDALLVRLSASDVVFVGDAFMPYLGAPFVAEGSPQGLLETIDTLSALRPRRLVHGHPPLTDFYTANVLAPLGAALRELERSTGESVRQARPLAAILDDDLLPAVLRDHPEAVMPYLLMRDQFVTRLQRQRTGYWQPDGQGLEVVSAAGRARALRLLAGGEERSFARASESLLESGDDALALEMVQAGLASFPESARLRDLRQRALDALRARSQQLNPFKFIVYSELRGTETPPLGEPGDERRTAAADGN
ncbi:MAG TPA: MBL fold metallo-hydrolase [Anaeromyxobacteraceae bacterium]|nr:MBL fold metallo-hydrolase [Anaeromyxobacteraceae bacterium]